MPLAAHICEDSRTLNLAAELSESLLQILPFSNLNLQNLLTSFNLKCNCAQRIAPYARYQPTNISLNGAGNQPERQFSFQYPGTAG